ncbi:MAG: transcriptional repressor [Campylobacteraceae bacterium]|jgi:Fur family ferric uptake transcriptional regulator|nr:transcriptional repressor [Campylobacteraceae bacterium]
MISKITITFGSFLEKVDFTLKSLGLNHSQNRTFVLHVLYHCDEHLSAKDIIQKIHDTFSCKLSQTTVYNIINLFEKLQIVNSLSLPNDIEKQKFYELNASYHHDHLICKKCYKIVEFYDNELECLQDSFCVEKKFISLSHSLLLFGFCEECQKS